MEDTFDDVGRFGLFYDDQGNPYREKPGTYGFCQSPSQDQYQAYLDSKRLELPPVDLGRHKDAKNPYQCEVKFFQDLTSLAGYREDPFSFAKNIGAGIINSIVPGSDLGDAYSGGQLVGGVLGAVAGAFIPTPGIGTLLNKADMALNLGGILSSPIINTIVGSVTSSLLAKPANPVMTTIPSAPPTQANSIIPGYNLVIDTGKGTVSTKPTEMPAWLMPVGLVVAAGLVLFTFLKRRK